MGGRAWLVIWLCVFAFGCDGPSATLVVQVRTDILPVREMAAVEVTLAEEAAERFDASSARDWGSGVRVFERALGVGEVRLNVSAVDSAGAVIVERPVRVDLQGGIQVVTVLLSRDCVGVVCPDAESPDAVACLGGRCVEPECLEEPGVDCGAPECATAMDCPDSAGTCARTECTESGTCFDSPDHTICMDDEVCSAELDCVSSTCSDWTMAITDAGLVGNSVTPSITATSDALILAWNPFGSDAVEAGRLELDGTLTMGFTLATGALDTQLVETATGAILAWQGGPTSIGFVALDDQAMQTSPPQSLTGLMLAGTYSIGWSGSFVGVAWADGRLGRSDLYFASADPTGGSSAMERPATMAATIATPQVVWTEPGFTTVYLDARLGRPDINLHGTTFDERGTPGGGGLLLDPPTSIAPPSVAWSGDTLGVVYPDLTTSELFFASFDRDLAQRVSPTVLAGPGARGVPRIVWDGSAFAVQWLDADNTLIITRLSAAGVRLGPPRNLGTLPLVQPRVGFIAAHGGYFVAYPGGPEPAEIQVAYICR